MRTVRLSLVGVAILMLLDGLGGLAVAQGQPVDPVSTESAAFSFTMPYIRRTTEPTFDLGEDRLLYRDVVYTSTIDAGDPRLHGQLWTIQNYVSFLDGGVGNVGSGFAGVDGEDGAWRGTFRSVNTHIGGMRSLYQVDMTGEGAYEGLSVRLFLIDNGGSHDVEGFIFSGDLPPMPEMTELPSD